MEEEIAKVLNRRAESNPRTMASNSTSSSPMSISSMKLFGLSNAKRPSIDEGTMSGSPPQFSTSPIMSSMLSQSPEGSTWTSSGTPPMMINQGRRDSLKNLWHLQDFGTD